MKISEKTWVEYITRLSRLNETAGKKMAEYIEKHGTDDVQALTAYAQALVQKYGEGSAELACQMYDAIAEASGVSIPPAEPAAPASCRETAGMVRATQQSPLRLQGGVSRLVKRVAADTTLKNALRDEAEWAWVRAVDADKNGTITQEEAKKYLDGKNLSREQKAKLFAMINKAWKSKIRYNKLRKNK